MGTAANPCLHPTPGRQHPVPKCHPGAHAVVPWLASVPKGWTGHCSHLYLRLTGHLCPKGAPRQLGSCCPLAQPPGWVQVGLVLQHGVWAKQRARQPRHPEQPRVPARGVGNTNQQSLEGHGTLPAHTIHRNRLAGLFPELGDNRMELPKAN